MQKQLLYSADGTPNLEFLYRCLIDIAAGMDYLHSLGVINGDLKPANVLLKSTSSDVRGITCKVSLLSRQGCLENITPDMHSRHGSAQILLHAVLCQELLGQSCGL